MRRQDIYVIVFGFVQIFAMLHTMTVLQAGAGISLMGENDFFGYVTIALVVGTFALGFSNLARLVATLSKDESAAMEDIQSVGRMSLVVLVGMVSLLLINAFALFAQYNYGA